MSEKIAAVPGRVPAVRRLALFEPEAVGWDPLPGCPAIEVAVKNNLS
jgi:hypothetical protein